MNTRSRTLLHLIATLCIAAVAIALVSQYAFDMQPCAWCVLQRLIFLLIAIVCWLGLLAGRRVAVLQSLAAALTVLLSLGGISAAWYQYTVASNMFSCDMTFADRFMAGSGLDAALPWLFGIYASCMDARVAILGVEYSLWGMGLFILTGILGLIALRRRPV